MVPSSISSENKRSKEIIDVKRAITQIIPGAIVDKVEELEPIPKGKSVTVIRKKITIRKLSPLWSNESLISCFNRSSKSIFSLQFYGYMRFEI